MADLIPVVVPQVDFTPPPDEQVGPDGTIYYTFAFSADTIKSLRRFLDGRREQKKNDVSGQYYEEQIFPEPGGTHVFFQQSLDTIVHPWVQRYPEGSAAEAVAAINAQVDAMKVAFRPAKMVTSTLTKA
jgi:hypothetical protein